MSRPRRISMVLVVFLSSLVAVSTAMACGGVKAFIVDAVPATDVRQAQGPNNVTFYYDPSGHALLPATAVQDAQSNLLASAHRTVGPHREYEWRSPLRNDDLGDTLWERDHTYMLAVLIGPQSRYTGIIDEAAWMSDQVLIRLGHPSTESIYRPPLTVATSPAPGIPGAQHDRPHQETSGQQHQHQH